VGRKMGRHNQSTIIFSFQKCLWCLHGGHSRTLANGFMPEKGAEAVDPC